MCVGDLDLIFVQVYMAGVIYFGLNTALAAIAAFLPTIIASFGFSTQILF